MAIACKCDVCGKLYEEYNIDESRKKPNLIEFKNGVWSYGGFSTRCSSSYELCPDCMASVLTCIEKLKGEKEV